MADAAPDIGLRSACLYMHATFEEAGSRVGAPKVNSVWLAAYAPEERKMLTTGFVYSNNGDAEKAFSYGSVGYRLVRSRAALLELAMGSVRDHVDAGYNTIAGVGVRHGMIEHLVRACYSEALPPYPALELAVQEPFPRLGVTILDVGDIYTQRGIDAAAVLHSLWRTGDVSAYKSLWNWSNKLTPSVDGFSPELTFSHDVFVSSNGPYGDSNEVSETVDPATLNPQAVTYNVRSLFARIDGVLALYTRNPARPYAYQ